MFSSLTSRSLLGRILGPVVLATVGATVLMGGLLFTMLHAFHQASANKEFTEMQRVAQNFLPQMMWNYDTDALQSIKDTFDANPVISAVHVVDDNGEVQLDIPLKAGSPERFLFHKKVPLQRFGKSIGAAEITFTRWPLFQEALTQTLIVLGSMGVAVGVFVFLLQMLIKRSLSPLVQLNARMGDESLKVGADVAGLSNVVQQQQFSGKEISDAVGESSNSLQQLNETLQQVTRTLADLVQRTRSSDTLVSQLGSQSEKIQSILTTIVAIADSTNLLALNAAIEAARAGEAGRGFSVVADEVKKLSAKTVIAAREVEGITTTLKTSIAQVQKELFAMAEGVRSIESDMQNVAGASDRQSATMSEINSTIVQFISHFRQTEETIATNIVRMNGLIGTIDEVHKAITGGEEGVSHA